jgi:hypothetical protein
MPAPMIANGFNCSRAPVLVNTLLAEAPAAMRDDCCSVNVCDYLMLLKHLNKHLSCSVQHLIDHLKLLYH